MRGGCTDSCLKLGEQALENVECKDQPAGGSTFLGGTRFLKSFKKGKDGLRRVQKFLATFDLFQHQKCVLPSNLRGLESDQIRWLRPAAQVNVGGSSGTPIHMLCPTFSVIICHFSEDPFLVSSIFAVFFLGMFLVKGFSLQIVGSRGLEQWCIRRSYPWWQR